MSHAWRKMNMRYIAGRCLADTLCYDCAYQIPMVKIMEVAIRKMGNSRGVLSPKPILAQLGL